MQRESDRLDLSGTLRALRRRADLSQRELATISGVPAATVGRLESKAATNPSLRTVERLVRATGARLAVLDLDGTEPAAAVTATLHDQAGRLPPAHLDSARVTWRGARHKPGIGFLRDRRHRDTVRRERAGERREDLHYVIRRLGPGDLAVLAHLRADRDEWDLAGRAGPDLSPVSDGRDRRYLRDPAVRHWIAETRVGGTVLGHLVAHIQHRFTGQPAMIVTEVGVRAEHRDQLVGPHLAAALCDEAAREGVGEITALAADPVVAAYLRSLGFTRPGRLRRPRLLSLPE